MDTTSEDDFQVATSYLSSRTDLNLSNEIMLEFYSLYKSATVGPCNTPKPSFFDFTGKAKWDAWKSLGDLPKNEATARYILLVQEHTGWKPGQPVIEEANTASAGGTKQGKSMGVSVSTMEYKRQEISDEDKTVWNWAEEGQTDKVIELISTGKARVDDTDEQGMTLLHWASDRGHPELARWLVAGGWGREASVNMRDVEGQTPLHYAVIVENEEIVRILVSAGADTSIPDSMGETPFDIATPDIREVIMECVKKIPDIGHGEEN